MGDFRGLSRKCAACGGGLGGARPSLWGGRLYCSLACRQRRVDDARKPGEERRCPGCSAVVVKERAKWCSRACFVRAKAREVARKRALSAARLDNAGLDCARCGTHFVPKRACHLYCSTACGQWARRNLSAVPRSCAGCGAEFTGKGMQAYCTKACRAQCLEVARDARRLALEAAKAEGTTLEGFVLPEARAAMRRGPRPCEFCGEVFQPTSGFQIYCGLECRSFDGEAASLARVRAELEADKRPALEARSLAGAECGDAARVGVRVSVPRGLGRLPGL